MCFSTVGTPTTSLRPSLSRSATDGGDADHCSHGVCATDGQGPWECMCESSTLGLSQRMNWPQPSRRPRNWLAGLVYQREASTDVPSGRNTLIWWLSYVTTMSC